MKKANERLRAISWADYGISDERYEELKHFCRQYQEKQKLVKSLGGYELPAVNYTAIRGGSGSASSPTESAAIRNYLRAEHALKDCRIIEEAAMWAAVVGGYREAWRAILWSVTRGVGYERLIARYELPFGTTDFYGIRRAFFHRLDQLQHGEGDESNRA